jgi:hypothetical protein
VAARRITKVADVTRQTHRRNMRYKLLPGGYVDDTGPHRGVPPTQNDFSRIALMFMHRTIFDPNLHAHLDMMSSDNAKKAYKKMESLDLAGKYLFEPKE